MSNMYIVLEYTKDYPKVAEEGRINSNSEN